MATSKRRTAVSAFLWSQFVYWCVAAVGAWALARVASRGGSLLLLLPPLAPTLLVAAVTHHIYRSCDEYVRHRILQSAAVTAIGMTLLVTGYLYLRRAGLPPLNLAWMNAFGWALFSIQLMPMFFMRVDEE